MRNLVLVLSIATAGSLTVVAGAAAAETGSMADAMTRMMDAFSDRLRWGSASEGSRGGTSGWSNQWQYPAQPAPWGPSGAVPWGQWGPQAPYPQAPGRDLTGAWVANSGAVMLIDRGQLRLYLSEDVSQDFELRVAGSELLLRDRQTGAIRRYGYARLDDHMLLRDPEGNVLLMRRMRGRLR